MCWFFFVYIDGFELSNHGGKSESEIEYHYFRRLYDSFNAGAETYQDLESELYWTLLESKGNNLIFFA